MGKFKPFLIGSIAGAAVMFVALQYHFVRTHDGVRVVPRTPQHGVGLAWVDIRNWDVETWADRPEVARALAATGATDLISESVTEDLMNSVSTDSPIDQLRGFLNDESGRDADPLFNAPEFLPTREGKDSSDSFGLDDPFAPLPREVRRPVNSDQSFKEFESTSIARSSDDIFREAVSPGPRSNDYPAFEEPPLADAPAAREALSHQEEMQLLEDMLFGGEADAHRQPSLQSQDDSSFGVFEDVTQQLEDRADDALEKVRRGFRERLSSTIDDTGQSIGRFSRQRIEERLPDSVGSMFRDDAANTVPAPATESQLPPALEALRNGFDPFVD